MRVFLSFFRLYALVSLWVRTPALLQKAASHNEGRPKKGGGELWEGTEEEEEEESFLFVLKQQRVDDDVNDDSSFSE